MKLKKYELDIIQNALWMKKNYIQTNNCFLSEDDCRRTHDFSLINLLNEDQKQIIKIIEQLIKVIKYEIGHF